MDETKTCTKCGRELPITAFRLRAKHKCSRLSWCKDCMYAYQRERYQNDPEYRRSQNEANLRQYYQKKDGGEK